MAAAAAMTRGRLVALAGVLVLAVCLQAAVAAKGTPYIVGGADGWRVPPPEVKERYYADWASSITFYVDDSIEFVYRNDSAIMVSKAGYYHCNETAPNAVPHDGTTLFVLDSPGPAYFASADRGRCAMGERLMIDVLPAAAAPAPWPAAPGPWSPWLLSQPPAAAGTSPVQHQHSAAAAALAAPSSAAHAVVVLAPVALALAAGLV
ncbi:hypothetical protein SEVIR_1G028000v4 [Setaria viridis]|uniref:Phytocyanin domain-containing protein n=1 Tax=Setaria viridis TaxID=4556 RepID=A0A4U6W6N8_SETVI|nr:mavicyanin-like [Setaria viridis]TKW37113.1 hypothetical protein SEVIR_1G028000v2 [Setaria viridis]